MAGNTFGQAFRITTFGESHGPAIGVVIDGCPPNLPIDIAKVQAELDRRKPGQSAITTPRTESDQVEILSGVFEGLSTGHPITLLIRNTNQIPKDYSHLKDIYRPSHADYTYQQKYGIRDYRGGGRASARETAARVAAGAIAKQLLAEYGVKITAFTQQIGNIGLSPSHTVDFKQIEGNLVRCPNAEIAAEMVNAIEQAKADKDSLGGVIKCLIENVPVGLGEPVFDKLEADLAKAMMSIQATKGFEIGSGFSAASMKGSEHNDSFINPNGDSISTSTNHSGGIQGGISNGEPIEMRIAFKPVATIGKEQETVDKDGNAVKLEAKGRHDPCVVPRAIPIVEAMAALVLADHWVRYNGNRPL
ncbi:MAG: chorismate synthase [Bacteroidetes bacterium]|nr:chorismate synthase [Bacteroidota bacterium]